MVQSAAASRHQPRLTSELSVTLGHHYTNQPRRPKMIRNVPTVNCSNKNPSFWLSSNTGLRLTRLHTCAPASSCHQQDGTASISTMSVTEVENRHGSAAFHDFPFFFSGFKSVPGPPFCQLLVAAGQQDGLRYRFPREPISFCHVRSYAHKLFWAACSNELLLHTAARRFWLFFFSLFYDSCSDLIYCTTTITTKTCF